MPPKIDVPPITTAATDGSRYDVASPRSAALVSADEQQRRRSPRSTPHSA